MNFTEDIQKKVWEKAKKIDGYNPDLYRQDACRAWIMRNEYGKESAFGWEIDHIFPVAKGGSDCIENLRPLHFRNNRSKGDNYPVYDATVTSQDNNNIEKTFQLTVNQATQARLEALHNK